MRRKGDSCSGKRLRRWRTLGSHPTPSQNKRATLSDCSFRGERGILALASDFVVGEPRVLIPRPLKIKEQPFRIALFAEKGGFEPPIPF